MSLLNMFLIFIGITGCLYGLVSAMIRIIKKEIMKDIDSHISGKINEELKKKNMLLDEEDIDIMKILINKRNSVIYSKDRKEKEKAV